MRFLDSPAGMIVVLFAGLLVFSAAVIVCAASLPTNEKLYVFLTGIAGNFSGALFTYLQIHKQSAGARKGGDDDERP